MTEKKTGLELLREPFPANQVSQLPKGTKAQNNCPANEKKNCNICGGWHHPQVIHLTYVGHAALTDRLLDADPLWTWEPLALKDGLPAFDETGGLWIKLTVCGHTRIGYGHAMASEYKEIGSREKEVIGDALRNAAMRFGAALDLWHKGDLHVDNGDDPAGGISLFEQWEIKASEVCEAAQQVEDIIQFWPDNSVQIKKELKKADAAKIYDMVVARKKELEAAERSPGEEG
uniref:Uncharacterized protein n=1 Tax=viral metagenome TaxID=1070528 RepID=A0A6M3LYQ7_9ZZZZ